MNNVHLGEVILTENAIIFYLICNSKECMIVGVKRLGNETFSRGEMTSGEKTRGVTSWWQND